MSNPNEDENKILVNKEIIEDYAQTKEALANLTEEIKDLRAKKNLEIEELKKGNGTTTDVESEVDKVLKKKELELVEKAKEEAILEFRESHPEFSSDNDPANLKFKAFEKELRKFNLTDLSTKEDVKRRIKEAYDFANRSSKKDDDNQTSPYAFSSKSGGSAGESPNVHISEKERKLIKMQNITEEAYFKMKEKRPHFINNLLKFID